VATGTATLPSLTGSILTFTRVTTFAGQATESLDLAGDLDTAVDTLSIGRLTAYDASNVKATGSVTLGAVINALLISGDNVTVSVPTGGTEISSNMIVNFGGASGPNVISGGTLTFNGSEISFITQGANASMQLSLNGATSGMFTLTMVMNTLSDPAPFLGTIQSTPAVHQSTGLLDIAVLTASSLQNALESLPAVGRGNVFVKANAGGFAITFIGALAGGRMPSLLVNNYTASPAPAITTLVNGGGTLSISSSIVGSGQVRKERKAG
jgi:hypothetical protein